MSSVHTHLEHDGQVARLVLARPKANVLDAEMIGDLRDALRHLDTRGALKLVVLDHEGPSFSFGASIEEHAPDRVAEMLRGFHDLLRAIEGAGVPTASVIHGQCLGGGLELALVTGRIFVDPTARLGLPEIKLGVFPPAGAVLLPLRVGTAAAVDLVLSGASIPGEVAKATGLVDHFSPDPRACCTGWFTEKLAPLSAVAVRQAWRAVRRPVVRALEVDLPAVERQYLEDLMAHRDPAEGLGAFLDKRQPIWAHA